MEGGGQWQWGNSEQKVESSTNRGGSNAKLVKVQAETISQSSR